MIRFTSSDLHTHPKETPMSDTIRISISSEAMGANAFDGGEFERRWPNAVQVPSRWEDSQSWEMTLDDAKDFLGLITEFEPYLKLLRATDK